MVSVGGLRCEKTESDPINKSFKVKILSEICNTAIVQIQDPTYYQYGASGYTATGVKYEHVFNTQFTCEDMQKMQPLTASRIGLVVTIKTVKEQKTDAGCVSCKALTYFPGAPKILVELLPNQGN